VATVTGLTADRMLEIEAASVVSGSIDGSGHLILTKHDASTVDAGAIRGSFDNASDTARGIVELATNAETVTGTDTVRATTPAGVAAVASLIYTAIGGKQDVDSDLTAIAAIAPSNDDFIQRKSGVWVNRSVAQVLTDLGATVKSTLTTKGDIYVATASATPARLGVGSNNQVLTADSAQTTGLKWATPSASGLTAADLGMIIPTGLVGDGTTNDQAAIQAALTAATPGQIVYLPPGKNYAIGSGLSIPSGVQLRGGYPIGRKWYMDPDVSKSNIMLTGSWTGSAITLPAASVDTVIQGISVTGWNMTGGTVHGITATNGAGNYQIRDVLIQGVSGRGVQCLGDDANTATLEDITVFSSLGHAFYLDNMSDMHVVNCSANNAGAPDGANVASIDGFWIHAGGNCTFSNLRAEFCTGNGFHVTGDWFTGIGSCNFTNLMTDRSGLNGILVDVNGGTSPIGFTSLYLNRDGQTSTSGGFAGFRVTHATSVTQPIWVNGITVNMGANDGGGGNVTPQYGINVDHAVSFQAVNGYIQAVSSAINTGAGNTRFFVDAIGTATGTYTAPTRSTVDNLAPYPSKTLLTNKGDLIVASAASTLVRLGIGSNNQVLTADSAQTTGVKWATPAAGLTTWWTRVRSGIWYPLTPSNTVGGTAAGTLVSNQEYAIPMVFGFSANITGLAINKGNTTGNIRLGIRADGGDMSPGATVLYDSGALGTAATVIAATGITGVTVSPGVPVWFTCTSQGGGGTVTMESLTHPFVGSVSSTTPVATDFTTAQPGMYAQTGVSGALPSSFTIANTGGNGSQATIVMKVQFGSITQGP
jgi:Pectate lyase superfamily protein